ncbi:DUF2505 domain-containing protein [Nocardioides speluncae]|uniref:DUF2505 domain-containing protein n=1 Tax=Nocardioides speluncae TaxID=2670337 RepID=UPI00137A5D8A|nr:DUF2505 domain-containing protein [Nocardioides speluncae]
MSKSVKHDIVYAGATVDEVVAMVTDPKFREAVCDYQQVVSRSATVTADGGRTKVVLDYAHATTQVPSFAKKFVGETIPIHQEETWSTPTSADVVVTIPGKPGDMKGRARIEQRGDDVVQTIDLAIKVGVPLVGGKLEGMIADLLSRAFKAENKVGSKWLAGEWRTES